jgi:hypothetical protein
MLKIYQSFHNRFLRNEKCDWIVPIAVGGYKDPSMLSDAENDHISQLNPFYCELTAVYWVWKNTSEDDVGFIHYRRYFDFLNKDRPFLSKMSYFYKKKHEKLLQNIANIKIRYNNSSLNYLTQKQQHLAAIEALQNFEVLIPSKQLLPPSMHEQYLDRMEAHPWNVFLDQIDVNHKGKLNPQLFFSNENMAPICNMFLMRRTQFNRYCEDLFPVLDRVFKKIGTPYDQYNNRYPGFLAERYLWYWINVQQIRYAEAPLVFLV